ncbi:MAG: hypothetical protein GC136_09510 [Alphaproteobacteria bacterium]|nr:hypothetical protein [Alphaproteobacteria bacterium]
MTLSFTKEDFPLIAIFESAPGNEMGAAHLRDGFEKAVNGSIDDKFDFAFALQTGIAWPESRAQMQQMLPTLTDAVAEKTLVKCYEIFELAAANNLDAAGMYYNFTLCGVGCEQDMSKAEAALGKLDQLAQEHPEYTRIIGKAREDMASIKQQLGLQ